MADNGWLAQVGKWAGGGAIGVVAWLGGIFTERARRRNTRRNLYKELLYNYTELRRWLATAPEYRSPDGAIQLPFLRHIYFHALNQAQKDLDGFNSIRESYTIRSLYDELIATLKEQDYPDRFAPLARYWCAMVDDCLVDGRLDLRTARQAQPKSQLHDFDRRIAHVQQHESMSEDRSKLRS